MKSPMPRRMTLFAAGALLFPGAAVFAAPEPPTEAQQVMAAVEKALQRHAGDVHACFGRALADRIDVAGKLELDVTVGAGGNVRSSEVTSKSDAVPEGLAACVREASSTWQLEGIEPGASVVLPFTFAGQAHQFVVNAADVPARPEARGKVVPPFQVKILADRTNVRARHMAVTHLTIAPANRVAMHRHAESAKILFVLSGAARVLGPKGQDPVKLSEGDAVFLPRGYPHVIENMGRQIPAVMLQVFSPAGPELVYRDPKDPLGRAAFEVLRGAAPGAPPGAELAVVRKDEGASSPLAGGKGQRRLVFDPSATGDASLALEVAEFAPGSSLPRQLHPSSEAFMWVVSGAGVVKVGAEDVSFGAGHAVFVPAGQPYTPRFEGEAPTVAVRLFAPAGPEHAPGQPASAPGAPASNPKTPSAAPAVSPQPGNKR